MFETCESATGPSSSVASVSSWWEASRKPNQDWDYGPEEDEDLVFPSAPFGSLELKYHQEILFVRWETLNAYTCNPQGAKNTHGVVPAQESGANRSRSSSSNPNMAPMVEYPQGMHSCNMSLSLHSRIAYIVMCGLALRKPAREFVLQHLVHTQSNPLVFLIIIALQ